MKLLGWRWRTELVRSLGYPAASPAPLAGACSSARSGAAGTSPTLCPPPPAPTHTSPNTNTPDRHSSLSLHYALSSSHPHTFDFPLRVHEAQCRRLPYDAGAWSFHIKSFLKALPLGGSGSGGQCPPWHRCGQCYQTYTEVNCCANYVVEGTVYSVRMTRTDDQKQTSGKPVDLKACAGADLRSVRDN